MSGDLATKVLDHIDRSRDAIVAATRALIDVPSVNPNYPGIRSEDYLGNESEANLFLRSRFGDLFDKSDLLWSTPKRENFAGVIHGAGGGRSLLLNGHIDVVPAGGREMWEHDPFVSMEKNGRIYGRGACDMKAGVIAAFAAVEALQQCGVRLKGDLTVHSVAGEELGEREVGTGHVLGQGYTADAAIVVEPSANFESPLAVNPIAAGLLWGRVRVEGLAGHPGLRRELIRAGGAGRRAGVNAIDGGYLVLQALYGLEQQWGITKQHPLFRPGHFVVMPGTVHGRGKDIDIPFVFAEYCEVDFLAWYPPEEEPAAVRHEIEEYVTRAVSLDPWLAEHPPAFTWLLEFPGYQTSPDHPMVSSLRSAHETATGSPAVVEGFAAACDASHLFAAGIPVVNYGPGNLADCHKANESVDIEEIVAATRSLALTAMQWCGVADGASA